MVKKVVAIRSRQKEGQAAASKPLTLADVAITWTEGTSTWETCHYVTGKTLVQAVRYLRDRHPNTAGHDPVGGQAMVPTYLRGLSYIMFPDAGTPTEEVEKDARFTLSEYLEHLSALLSSEGGEATKYEIHVGPVPAEWTK
jgi:hypothetical protein